MWIKSGETTEIHFQQSIFSNMPGMNMCTDTHPKDKKVQLSPSGTMTFN